MRRKYQTIFSSNRRRQSPALVLFFPLFSRHRTPSCYFADVHANRAFRTDLRLAPPELMSRAKRENTRDPPISNERPVSIRSRFGVNSFSVGGGRFHRGQFSKCSAIERHQSRYCDCSRSGGRDKKRKKEKIESEREREEMELKVRDKRGDRI